MFSGLSIYSLFGILIFLPLGYFIYRGHQWAMISAMLFWSGEKFYQIYAGLQNSATYHYFWFGLIWWAIYMRAFYLAFKVEKARRKMCEIRRDTLPAEDKISANFIPKSETQKLSSTAESLDDFYAQAWDEINDQNKTPEKALWAKSFAIAQGDEKKAQAKYIELRVAQLHYENNQREIMTATNDDAAMEKICREANAQAVEEARRRATYPISEVTQQKEEFIALLKSTVNENKLETISNEDLLEICKRARSIDDSSKKLDMELSRAINTLLEEIKKRGLSQDSKPQEIYTYKNSFLKQRNVVGISKWVYAITIPIIVIVIALLVNGFYEREMTAENWLNKEKTLWKGGKCTDPKKAIEYLNNAIELKPDYAEAFGLRGLIYDTVLGQYHQAIKDYSEAIRLHPDYDSLNYNRGLAYSRLGLYRQAIEDFNEAIRIEPYVAEAYFCRGNGYLKLGQYQRASEDFNEAINLKQDYVDAYNNRGVAYFSQFNNELGCRDAQKVCELGDCKFLEAAKSKGLCR
jgi:tetratricopeptide (TPR) repeat protein